MSTVGYDNPGASNKPSPAIWGDCPKSLLNEEGLGYFFFERFAGFTPLSTTVDNGTVSDNIRFRGDTDTTLSLIDDSRYGGVAVDTNTTAGDGGALVSVPFGRLVRNSGEKLWAEARIASKDVDDDLGMFFGLVELDGATHDIIADNPASDSGLADQSLLGFFQNNGDPDALNVVKRIAGGSVATVLSDVTNSTAIEVADRASLTDAGYVKAGMRFDGRTTVTFYINGIKVGSQEVDSTIDQSQDYCLIAAIKTGDGATEGMNVGFMGAAFQDSE